MGRAFGTVALLVVACLVLPTIARLAYAAVPALLSLLVLLAVARLAWPAQRRR